MKYNSKKINNFLIKNYKTFFLYYYLNFHLNNKSISFVKKSYAFFYRPLPFSKSFGETQQLVILTHPVILKRQLNWERPLTSEKKLNNRKTIFYKFHGQTPNFSKTQNLFYPFSFMDKEWDKKKDVKTKLSNFCFFTSFKRLLIPSSRFTTLRSKGANRFALKKASLFFKNVPLFPPVPFYNGGAGEQEKKEKIKSKSILVSFLKKQLKSSKSLYSLSPFREFALSPLPPLAAFFLLFPSPFFPLPPFRGGGGKKGKGDREKQGMLFSRQSINFVIKVQRKQIEQTLVLKFFSGSQKLTHFNETNIFFNCIMVKEIKLVKTKNKVLHAILLFNNFFLIYNSLNIEKAFALSPFSFPFCPPVPLPPSGDRGKGEKVKGDRQKKRDANNNNNFKNIIFKSILFFMVQWKLVHQLKRRQNDSILTFLPIKNLITHIETFLILIPFTDFLNSEYFCVKQSKLVKQSCFFLTLSPLKKALLFFKSVPFLSPLKKATLFFKNVPLFPLHLKVLLFPPVPLFPFPLPPVPRRGKGDRGTGKKQPPHLKVKGDRGKGEKRGWGKKGTGKKVGVRQDQLYVELYNKIFQKKGIKRVKTKMKFWQNKCSYSNFLISSLPFYFPSLTGLNISTSKLVKETEILFSFFLYQENIEIKSHSFYLDNLYVSKSLKSIKSSNSSSLQDSFNKEFFLMTKSSKQLKNLIFITSRLQSTHQNFLLKLKSKNEQRPVKKSYAFFDNLGMSYFYIIGFYLLNIFFHNIILKKEYNLTWVSLKHYYISKNLIKKNINIPFSIILIYLNLHFRFLISFCNNIKKRISIKLISALIKNYSPFSNLILNAFNYKTKKLTNLLFKSTFRNQNTFPTKLILWQWNKKNQNKNSLYSIFKKYWLKITTINFAIKIEKKNKNRFYYSHSFLSINKDKKNFTHKEQQLFNYKKKKLPIFCLKFIFSFYLSPSTSSQFSSLIFTHPPVPIPFCPPSFPIPLFPPVPLFPFPRRGKGKKQPPHLKVKGDRGKGDRGKGEKATPLGEGGTGGNVKGDREASKKKHSFFLQGWNKGKNQKQYVKDKGTELKDWNRKHYYQSQNILKIFTIYQSLKTIINALFFFKNVVKNKVKIKNEYMMLVTNLSILNDVKFSFLVCSWPRPFFKKKRSVFLEAYLFTPLFSKGSKGDKSSCSPFIRKTEKTGVKGKRTKKKDLLRLRHKKKKIILIKSLSKLDFDFLKESRSFMKSQKQINYLINKLLNLSVKKKQKNKKISYPWRQKLLIFFQSKQKLKYFDFLKELKSQDILSFKIFKNNQKIKKTIKQVLKKTCKIHAVESETKTIYLYTYYLIDK